MAWTRARFQFAIILGLCSLFITGCASQTADTTKSAPFPSIQTPSGEYETLEGVTARDLLPTELFEGEGYQILDEVTPNGLAYRFTLDSPYGRFEPYGVDMLQIRIREILALKEVHEISQPTAFGLGVAYILLSPFRFIWDMATEPKDTAMGVPKGMWKTMTRIAEMVVGERGEFEESAGKELVGFSMVKRSVASYLGIDSYSSNDTLQSAIEKVALAGYAGGMSTKLALTPITGPAGFALAGTFFGAAMNDVFRQNSPEDLRRMNRELMERMNLDEGLIDEFLSHPWYSPLHETKLVQALVEMEGTKNREGFIRVALRANKEEEALFFQRLAEMMANYHQTVIPIDKLFIIEDRLILGYTDDGALVATVPVFRLPWTREVAQAADAVVEEASARIRVRRLEVWLTGEFTHRARQELESRGFMIHEGAFLRLLGPPVQQAPDPT
jgi:hypothetical protein